MAKNLFQFRNPLTFSGSSGFTVNNPGVNITGVDRKDFVFSIGQDVSSTSDVVFNQVTPDKIIIGSVDSTHIVWTDKSVSASNGTLTQTAGEFFNISGDLTVPNLTLTGEFTTDKIEAQLTGSSTIFESGSTEFGDTIDDTHERTGSLSISGSFSLNNFLVDEISNDTADDGGSQTALSTEKVAYNAFGDQTPGFEFTRKKFAHTGSFVSSTTSSFTAVTASKVETLDGVTKHDFMFFNKGMLMEYDALDIEQSGSTLLLKMNIGSMGYGFDNNDEIVGWGKFNS